MPQHSLQARLDMSKTDKRLYDPNRDIAHNFAAVAMEVAKRLEQRKWSTLYDSLIVKPNDDELSEACKSFIMFVASAVQDPTETMPLLMERSGFLKCTNESQVALMTVLGQVMLGMYFHGARMATTDNVGPCSDMADLIAAGKQSCLIMSAPPWKRWWCKLTGRLSRAFNAFKSGTK